MAQHRVKLSKADWEEIYYALQTKKQAVQSGAMGAEDRPGADKAWEKHLDHILSRIGSDGEQAIARGVAPAEK